MRKTLDLLRWGPLAIKKPLFHLISLNFSPNIPDLDCKICLTSRKKGFFSRSKASIVTRLFCFGFLFSAIGLIAQNPQVLGVAPKHLSGNAAPLQNIEIQFDAALDPASVSAASVRVFGRWSGPAAGVFALTDGDKRIVFTPAEPFFAGEMVTVCANRLLRAASGVALEPGYFWQYNIRTAPGSLQQNQVDVIELRLPDESWIQTYGAYAGDLNNDGHSDITTVNEHSDDLRILLNNGAGQFPATNINPIPMGTASASPNEAADFDNDGEIDLVVTTAHHNETRILFGDGQGGFPQMDKYTTGNATRAVVVGDFDFDGDDDILTANRNDGTMNRLENQGDGTFVLTQFNPNGNGESALALTDANNDGIADFFVGFYATKKVALFLGDGLGNFNFSTEMTVTGNPWMMCFADFNGDGYADVASANSQGNKTAVLFGDGIGGLSAPVNLNANDHIFPLAIDAGDLDGDGDVDLVTSSYDSNNYSVFENDGAGNFIQVDILPASLNASCAILHDRDGDGDLDITGTDEGDDVLILFENPGVSAVYEPDARALDFQLFPNPADGPVFAKIRLETPSAARVEVFDFSGKKIQTREIDPLPEGVSHVLLFEQVKEIPAVCRVQVTLTNGRYGGALLLKK
ncbi:MAG: FG-GAP-like repeat-containing protein [Saprospiraceae bacterium]|nr:FG-GAP-like repeat-containing protein [Saprospiraceae bacterium]